MQLILPIVLVLISVFFAFLYLREKKVGEQRRRELEALLSEAEKALAESEKSTAVSLNDLEVQKRFVEQKAQEIEQLQSELRDQQEKLIKSEKDLAAMKASSEERERSFAEQLKQLQDSRDSLKLEFKSLANEILEEKGKSFGEKNSQQIETLLNPFKQQMVEFKERVEAIHQNDLVQRSALTNELKNIKELNQQMTAETQALTNALKGDKKTQGNWGELMLENVLERSGLTKEMIYSREKAVKDLDEGVAGRMDVVVRLPEGKHLVIDSKVSLNAYTRSINAESETEQQVALKEHLQAMQNHISELSGRDYTSYSEINSPDIVFMFVPVESAFVEACKFDDSLVQTAWDKGILLVTPTTLLASLKIVAQLWRLENQNKSTAALADKARKVYEKLKLFLESMERLGGQIDTVNKTYDRAVNQLTSGKGNLVKQANEFKELGVRVKGSLPEFFSERGELELDEKAQLTQPSTN